MLFDDHSSRRNELHGGENPGFQAVRPRRGVHFGALGIDDGKGGAQRRLRVRDGTVIVVVPFRRVDVDDRTQLRAAWRTGAGCRDARNRTLGRSGFSTRRNTAAGKGARRGGSAFCRRSAAGTAVDKRRRGGRPGEIVERPGLVGVTVETAGKRALSLIHI